MVAFSSTHPTQPNPIHPPTSPTQEATSLLLRATQLQPDLPKTWKALVDLYEGEGRWLDALKGVDKLIEIAKGKGNEERALLLLYHTCTLHE